MPLDDLDRTLINGLQKDFPLVARPFGALAVRLGTDERDVLRRVEDLKSQGLIRQIGPVVDGRRLGYRSTLLAMKIDAQDIPRTEKAIAAHNGISHAYERNHDFNVWVTLAVPSAEDIEAAVADLQLATGATEAVSLPAVRVFKIGVFFDMTSEGETMPGAVPEAERAPAVLSSIETKVLNVLQTDLPLVEEPFAVLGARAGLDAGGFLSVVGTLRDKGVIRRFGASVNHHRAGFASNVMSCWAVTPAGIERAAAVMSASAAVSHCYERCIGRTWRYNLFAMVHGHSTDECEATVSGIASATGIDDHASLHTVREIKKARLKYRV